MSRKSAYKINFAKELEENLINFFSNLDVELSFTVLNTQIVTGIPHPLLNYVIRTRFTPNNASDEIKRIISHFKWRKLPFTWWTDLHTTPSNLGSLLESYGLTHLGTFAGLSLELNPIEMVNSEASQVQIEPIIDSNQLVEWAKILSKVYLFTPSMANAYSELFLQKIWMAGQNICPYLATVRGVPIGSFTLFINDGVAEIFHLAVHPEARGQGIGSAIVEVLIELTKEMGCRYLLLQTSSNTEKLFQNLGFQKISELDAFVWPGTEMRMGMQHYEI
jgi:ribosomal protein S18 acetylase RimI-like enzyme